MNVTCTVYTAFRAEHRYLLHLKTEIRETEYAPYLSQGGVIAFATRLNKPVIALHELCVFIVWWAVYVVCVGGTVGSEALQSVSSLTFKTKVGCWTITWHLTSHGELFLSGRTLEQCFPVQCLRTHREQKCRLSLGLQGLDWVTLP